MQDLTWTLLPYSSLLLRIVFILLLVHESVCTFTVLFLFYCSLCRLTFGQFFFSHGKQKQCSTAICGTIYYSLVRLYANNFTVAIKIGLCTGYKLCIPLPLQGKPKKTDATTLLIFLSAKGQLFTIGDNSVIHVYTPFHTEGAMLPKQAFLFCTHS